jgi:hypothetical protein
VTTTSRLHASFDAQLTARITGRRELLYVDGADAALDRPRHVRAASGLVWWGRELAVIQDDASFIALVDPATGRARAIPLPAGPAGARLFEERRGTKKLKLDLESCVVAELAGRPHLIAFGSGSSPLRERIVTLPLDHGERDADAVRVLPAKALYAALRACPELHGAELNLEGAVVRDQSLLLLQRGNGSAALGHAPNAVCSLPWPSVARYLASGGHFDCPAVEHVGVVDLPELAGVRLTFTDATLAGGELLFLATAEASPNAVDDGAVEGSSLGRFDGAGRVRLGHLLDETGSPCREKVEGLVADPAAPRRVLLTVDADDPDRPSELLAAELLGPWYG